MMVLVYVIVGLALLPAALEVLGVLLWLVLLPFAFIYEMLFMGEKKND